MKLLANKAEKMAPRVSRCLITMQGRIFGKFACHWASLGQALFADQPLNVGSWNDGHGLSSADFSSADAITIGHRGRRSDFHGRRCRFKAAADIRTAKRLQIFQFGQSIGGRKLAESSPREDWPGRGLISQRRS